MGRRNYTPLERSRIVLLYERNSHDWIKTKSDFQLEFPALNPDRRTIQRIYTKFQSHCKLLLVK